MQHATVIGLDISPLQMNRHFGGGVNLKGSFCNWSHLGAAHLEGVMFIWSVASGRMEGQWALTPSTSDSAQFCTFGQGNVRLAVEKCVILEGSLLTRWGDSRCLTTETSVHVELHSHVQTWERGTAQNLLGLKNLELSRAWPLPSLY